MTNITTTNPVQGLPSMRIGVYGPHGSGKTTLVNSLREAPEFANIIFLPEVTRAIRAAGFQINESGTLDTQMLILATHIQNLYYNNRFITDRCIIDWYVYSSVLLRPRTFVKDQYWDRVADQREYNEFMAFAKHIEAHMVQQYDALIYVPAEFALVSDGVRSVDEDFYRSVTREFESNVHSRSFLSEKDSERFITVSGSVEERKMQVLEMVRRFETENR